MGFCPFLVKAYDGGLPEVGGFGDGGLWSWDDLDPA